MPLFFSVFTDTMNIMAIETMWYCDKDSLTADRMLNPCSNYPKVKCPTGRMKYHLSYTNTTFTVLRLLSVRRTERRKLKGLIKTVKHLGE